MIKELIILFCMLGIPNTIVSDNWPQFVSDKFGQFVKWWDITYITSSLRHPESSGEAKRAVQSVKGLMCKNINYHAALCAYCDTPVTGGYSAAELLFGRSSNSIGIHRNMRVDVKRPKLAKENSWQHQAQYYDSKH